MRRALFTLCLMIAAGLAPQGTDARDRDRDALTGDQLRHERRTDEAPGISRGEAARRAQQMNGGGRVLSVETSRGGHRVKLLKDGEVRTIFVSGE